MTREPHIHTPAHDPVRRDEFKTYGSFDPPNAEAEAAIGPLLRYQTRRVEPERRERLPPIRDIGSPEWWRALYQRQARPKPDWWDRTFALPWEKADD